MKKRLIGILTLLLAAISLLTACNENEVDEEVQAEEADQEEAEASDNTYDEEPEADDVKTLDNEEKILEEKSITIQQELWHSNRGESYEVYGKVGPIVRDGDLAILPVILNTDSDLTVTFTSLFDHGLGTGEGIATQQGLDIRMIDTEEMTVSHPAVLLLDDHEVQALHTFVGDEINRMGQYTFGDSRDPARYFGVFAAPETESVHVLFRRLGVMEDIPVINREELSTLTIEDMEKVLEDKESDEEREEVFSQVIPTIEEIIERELNIYKSGPEVFDGNLERIQARVFPIESYREGVDTSVSRIDEIEHATLMISTDVLFEFDSSDLMDEADKELEAAAAELAGAEGGELEIVGHTDKEGTEDYNQSLSEDRAESVRKQLGELMDLQAFDVSVRGESFREPIADNDSEEGRAQNRRVELHFTPPAEEVEVEIETAAELPEALGEEAVYPDSIQTEDGEIEIESIRQIDHLLVGRIRVSSSEEAEGDYTALTFGFGNAIGARGWYADEAIGYSQYTAYAPTLIHNNQRYYPLDYYLDPLEGSYAEKWLEGAEEEMEYIIPLAERHMRSPGEDGYFTSTVIWPAVSDESVTVDLTVPGNRIDELSENQMDRLQPWRFTNVPVETETQLEDE
ncbi:OmpA family protein [Virgibacillus kimchii]